jgi:hypothetical protein
MQLVRIWLEERRPNKKAGTVLLNGDKDRNRRKLGTECVESTLR